MTNHDHRHSNVGHDLSERYSQQTWDARYAESDRLWSGNPNPRLVEHVADLTTGDVLDVGAGEGADAVWLAARGWRVTAIDISPVALARAQQHAAEAGVEISTVQHDLLGDAPLPGTYDLVSVQFWHPPTERFADFRDVLGAAVRPGGALLVVGHHPDDLKTGVRDSHGHAELLFTAEKVAALFPADQWDVRLPATPLREMQTPDGPAMVADAVLLAFRR